jgi:hypothetical protein
VCGSAVTYTLIANQIIGLFSYCQIPLKLGATRKRMDMNFFILRNDAYEEKYIIERFVFRASVSILL